MCVCVRARVCVCAHGRARVWVFNGNMFDYMCIIIYFFVPCGKFGSGTAAARAPLYIPVSVCSIFVCGMVVIVWDFYRLHRC